MNSGKELTSDGRQEVQSLGAGAFCLWEGNVDSSSQEDTASVIAMLKGNASSVRKRKTVKTSTKLLPKKYMIQNQKKKQVIQKELLEPQPTETAGSGTIPGSELPSSSSTSISLQIPQTDQEKLLLTDQPAEAGER